MLEAIHIIDYTILYNSGGVNSDRGASKRTIQLVQVAHGGPLPPLYPLCRGATSAFNSQ